jgi:hypothetical protein
MTVLFKKREKIILYLTIIVVIFSVSFNYLRLPIFNKNEELNREILASRTKLKKYHFLLAQKDQILSKLKRLSVDSKFIASQDTVVAAFASLEDLAKAANIKIVDIRPQATLQSKKETKEMVIELKAEGAMEDYIKFIYELENSLLLLRIKQCQLTSKPNAELLEGNFVISQPVF